MTCGIHVNDIGTEIRINITDCDGNIIDISNATSIVLIFQKPSGVSISKIGSFVTDGVDGLVKYIVQAGDLNEIGTWKVQAVITAPNGIWSSNLVSFKVHRNL